MTAGPSPEPAGELGRTVCVRQATRADAEGVAEVCWHTGFMGEDLYGLGRFADRRLFSYLFCRYFVLYEPGTCFVACAGERVVGYIIGTARAADYERRYRLRMGPRIVLRLLLVTWWRYPESARELLRWLRLPSDEAPPTGYDAFLHINLLPAYQRLGLGATLLATYERRLRELGSQGVYLGTSDRNRKAVPFYRKHGYELLSRAPSSLWSGVDRCEALRFGKRLGEVVSSQ